MIEDKLRAALHSGSDDVTEQPVDHSVLRRAKRRVVLTAVSSGLVVVALLGGIALTVVRVPNDTILPPADQRDSENVERIEVGMGRCGPAFFIVEKGNKPDPDEKPMLRMGDIGYSYSADEVEIVIRMAEPIPESPPPPAESLRWDITLVPPGPTATIELTRDGLQVEGGAARVDRSRLRVTLAPEDSFPGVEVVYREIGTRAKEQGISC